MSQTYFNQILEIVYKKSPLQKKKLENYLASCDESFFKTVERFSIDYIGYLKSQNISVEYAVDAYLKMCGNMLKNQIYFMKTEKYPVEQANDAFENVYNNRKEMTSHMIGIAISQLLWPTHYGLLSFFKDSLKENGHAISSYLEIGPGHGLYLREAMQYLNNDINIVAVDISLTAIEIVQSIMKYFFKERTLKITYHNIDMLDLRLSDKYDFITMGEVLEHVNYPDRLLNKLKELLASDGKAFISTCVNCPTIDHVYHFKSVDEIKDMLNGCGLLIKDERILPVENLSMEEIIKRKITINYCAIVSRKV